jgi:hypothetical protein
LEEAAVVAEARVGVHEDAVHAQRGPGGHVGW